MTVTATPPTHASPPPTGALLRAPCRFTAVRNQNVREAYLAEVLLVVGSSVLLARGLQSLVTERGLFRTVQKVSSATEALAVAVRGSAMIVVDGGAGTSQDLSRTCLNLLGAAPQCRVIVISAPADPAAFRSCFDSGISGWVYADSDDLAIATALEMAHRGQRFIDSRVAINTTERSSGGAQPLTHREREVLSVLSEGCSNRAIAKRLAISETTVKGHVSSILAKLGAESRLKAALMASELP